MTDHPASDGVGARFSAAASTYDRHAEIQAEAALQLMGLLPGGIQPARILDVGCGTGRLTRLLLERFPFAVVDAIDLAPGMIAEARRLLDSPARVRWLTADVRRHGGVDPYSLIVANCSLHWLDPLPPSMRHLAGLLADDGILAATVMLDGTLAELHQARRLAAPAKVPRGRMPTPDLLLAAVKGSGLRVDRFEAETVSRVCPSVERLIHDLRRQGITSGPLSRGDLPLNRSEVRRLIDEYRAAHSVEGGVRVTYRIGMLLVGKPVGGATPGRQGRLEVLDADPDGSPSSRQEGCGVLIYDGSCHFCVSRARGLVRLARAGSIEMLDLHDPSVPRRFPSLDPADLEKALHWVEPDGRTHVGFDAVAGVLATCPGLGWASRLCRLPGIRRLGAAAYAWVARHRTRSGLPDRRSD